MFKLLEKSLAQGAEFADIFYLETTKDSIAFENNKLNAISSTDLSGFTLRVKKDGKAGMVSSSNAEQNDELLKIALTSSVEGEALDYEFNRPETLPQIKLTDDSIERLSYERLISDGEVIIKAVREYDPAINVSVQIVRGRETKSYLNTYGCEYIDSSDILVFSAGGILILEESILEAYAPFKFRSTNYSPTEIANDIIEQIQRGRVETKLNGGKMPVILTPNALSQLAIAIANGLSGETVRSGISPLKGKIGEQIFSEMITLIDDPLIPGGLNSASFDDEGTPSERTVLYENGVLRNYLLGLKSAHALGMKPNGKAARGGLFSKRSYATTPNPWFTNLTMAPGKHSLEELMGDIKEGIMIDNMMGLVMGNLVAGAIDSDIDMAYKIQDGKLAGRVKSAAIGMNIYEVLKNQVVGLENKTHLTSDGYYLPHILLKDVNITV